MTDEFFRLVSRMMPAADELAAGAEALGVAINQHAEALEVFADAGDDDAVSQLDEAETELVGRNEAVMRQLLRYARRAGRVRTAISENRSAAAADALVQLGEKLANADLPTGGGAQ